MEKAIFSITCTTCQARLVVRSEAAIGAILECPKCESMVHVVPPPGWMPTPHRCRTIAFVGPQRPSAARPGTLRFLDAGTRTDRYLAAWPIVAPLSGSPGAALGDRPGNCLRAVVGVGSSAGNSVRCNRTGRRHGQDRSTREENSTCRDGSRTPRHRNRTPPRRRPNGRRLRSRQAPSISRQLPPDRSPEAAAFQAAAFPKSIAPTPSLSTALSARGRRKTGRVPTCSRGLPKKRPATRRKTLTRSRSRSCRRRRWTLPPDWPTPCAGSS